MSIAQDTQKMDSYGISDLFYAVVENEREEKEHEREMEKLKSQIQYAETVNQATQSTSSDQGFSLDRETMVGIGAFAVIAFLGYKFFT